MCAREHFECKFFQELCHCSFFFGTRERERAVCVCVCVFYSKLYGYDPLQHVPYYDWRDVMDPQYAFKLRYTAAVNDFAKTMTEALAKMPEFPKPVPPPTYIANHIDLDEMEQYIHGLREYRKKEQGWYHENILSKRPEPPEFREPQPVPVDQRTPRNVEDYNLRLMEHRYAKVEWFTRHTGWCCSNLDCRRACLDFPEAKNKVK